MMERTCIFSEIPFIPGRKQQIPRIIKSTFTPAIEALYKARMISGSTSAFIFAMIRASLSAFALFIS